MPPTPVGKTGVCSVTIAFLKSVFVVGTFIYSFIQILKCCTVFQQRLLKLYLTSVFMFVIFIWNIFYDISKSSVHDKLLLNCFDLVALKYIFRSPFVVFLENF